MGEEEIQDKRKSKQRRQQETQLQKRRTRVRGVEGSATDCDFEGGVTNKIAFFCLVKKCVDVETIQKHFEGGEIPFKTVDKPSFSIVCSVSFKLTVPAEHFDKVIDKVMDRGQQSVREYRLSFIKNKTWQSFCCFL